MKRAVITLIIVVIVAVGLWFYLANNAPAKKLIDDDTIEKVESSSLRESLKVVKEESSSLLDSITDEGEKAAIVNRNDIINAEIEKSRWKDFDIEQTEAAMTDSLNDISKNCNRRKYRRIINQCDTDIALGAYLEENLDFKNKLRNEFKAINKKCGW